MPSIENSHPSAASVASEHVALVVVAVAFAAGEKPAVSSAVVETGEQADLLCRTLHSQMAEVHPRTVLETRVVRFRSRNHEQAHA